MARSSTTGDVQGIVGAGVEIFGSVPYENYTFLFKVRPTPGSAGLEHLNSTRITVGQNDFSSGARYQRFLYVIAHEFFHAWNVKRIRPVALGPFDYTAGRQSLRRMANRNQSRRTFLVSLRPPCVIHRDRNLASILGPTEPTIRPQ